MKAKTSQPRVIVIGWLGIKTALAVVLLGVSVFACRLGVYPLQQGINRYLYVGGQLVSECLMTKSGFIIRSYIQTSGSATTADGWIITGQSENSLFQQRLVNSYSSPSIRLAECSNDTIELELEFPMIEKYSFSYTDIQATLGPHPITYYKGKLSNYDQPGRLYFAAGCLLVVASTLWGAALLGGQVFRAVVHPNT